MQECGLILYECKDAKSWNERWIEKLKEDMRIGKADVAVIVSTILPKYIEKFGKKDGIWIDNYSSGELYSKINYLNDEKEGAGNFYYKSGSVSQEGKYVKGNKSGVWVNYEENGKIASEINYVDNRMEGEAKYYEKGKLVCNHNHTHRILYHSDNKKSS